MVISIPRAYMGHTLQESLVKRGLLELCPGLHFDMGAALNIWHPYMDSRQGIFHRGRFISAMDRHTLSELPVWTLKRDLIEVGVDDVRPGELAIYTTSEVGGYCHKCRHMWRVPHRPPGQIACPALCGNVGQVVDPTLFFWSDLPSGKAYVWRQVRDRIALVGWRHTFAKLARGRVPGVSQATLEAKFGVDLMAKMLDPMEIPEHKEADFLSAAPLISVAV